MNVQGPDRGAIFAADRVFGAIGRKAGIRRLAFRDGLFGRTRAIGSAPALNHLSEPGIAGLRFAGFASAPSPISAMRFIDGARFAVAQVARRLSGLVIRSRALAGGFTTHETA